MDTILTGLLIVAGFAGGVGGGFLIRAGLARQKIDSAEARAEQLLKEAKEKEKDLLLKAKEKSLETIEEAKKEERERHEKLDRMEERMEKREEALDRSYTEIEQRRDELNKKVEQVRIIKKQLEDAKKEQIDKLQKIAELPREKARELLLKQVEQTMSDTVLKRMEKLEREGQDQLEERAREIMTLAIQRTASSHAAESTATTISLPSDEMKGRIIGREGRNIRAIERLTGVEIVVDDTPEAIVISGFSPVRRQIAKQTLEKLISDGRIHPSRIEEAVEQAKQNIAKHIKEAGEAVVYDLGITGLPAKLVQLIGRLKFRTSYGQNVLKHTLEVAHLSAIIASELGLDVKLAKMAGLLHDIGKAVDQEVQGTHVEIGTNLLRKFGIDEKVIATAMAHHEDIPYSNPESRVVQAADAISSSRTGARRDSYEEYIKRLEDLEAIALSFIGVEKTYAIQAGREIRVFVRPEQISDLEMKQLARQVADKIEEELKYPGEIKVHVIRETRVMDFAR